MSSSVAISIAGDRQIVALIASATRRLVVVAPAVTTAVAEAICERWTVLGVQAVSVILDVDQEVYQLGYGDQKAFELLTKTAADLGAALRRQPGVRIGIVISDDQTMVYSPTPQLIEAGPNTKGGANAIYLGPPPPALEQDLSPMVGSPRVGASLMSDGDASGVLKKLAENPPQSFDIARRMNVFNSHFEFVDLELTGVQIARKTVAIPPTLMGVTDKKTMDQIRSQFKIVPPGNKLSGDALRRDRDLIARRFIQAIPKFGPVVRRSDKPDLLKAVDVLRQAVSEFRAKVEMELQDSMDKSRLALVQALLPGVQRNPPKQWLPSTGQKPDKETCRIFLEQELARAFGSARALLNEMQVQIQFKGVTYETLKNKEFLEAAAKAGLDVSKFHEEYEAAKATPIT